MVKRMPIPSLKLTIIKQGGLYMNFTNLFNLSDKVALITGGRQGLGNYIAKGLAQYGAKIVIIDLEEPTKSEFKDLTNDYLFIRCDVTDQNGISQAVKKIVQKFRRIDILVNCAGTAKRALAEDMSTEVWDKVLKVNLYGTFFMCRAVGRVMIEQKKGNIINMSSQASVIGLPRGNTNYSASKAGLLGLTKTLAVEWAKYNIRVNSISPCHFKTPLTEALLADPETAQGILARIPLGRVGEDKDIVGPAIFLASEASGMVTGHNLLVDGGVTISY